MVLLLLLRTPTRKSRGVWDREISGARTEAPGLLSRRDLFIVDVEIHSENVEHPGAIGWSSVLLENEVFWIFTHLRKKAILQHREIIESNFFNHAVFLRIHQSSRVLNVMMALCLTWEVSLCSLFVAVNNTWNSRLASLGTFGYFLQRFFIVKCLIIYFGNGRYIEFLSLTYATDKSKA